MKIETKFSLGDILHDTRRGLMGKVIGISIWNLNESEYMIEYRIEANGKTAYVNETPQVKSLKRSKKLVNNHIK